MKSSHASGIRKIERACVVAVALIGIGYAATAVLVPEMRYIRQAYRAWSGNRVEVRPAEVACPLPSGWQADWKGEVLWITHYNSDGTVADALPFDSLEGLYDWVEDHPDFCDVDVEKLVLRTPEALATTTTVPTSDNLKTTNVSLVTE